MERRNVLVGKKINKIKSQNNLRSSATVFAETANFQIGDQPKRAPPGAAWSILQKGASRVPLAKGATSSRPFNSVERHRSEGVKNQKTKR